MRAAYARTDSKRDKFHTGGGARGATRPTTLFLQLALLCVLASAMIFPANQTRAQQVRGMEASSFRVQLETHEPPNQAQIKTSLEGSKAEPQAGGKVLLTEPRLNRYTTNGVLDVQVRSSNCIFDTMLHTVSSTNVLEVEMANGKFYTEGRGFLRQTNGAIILSNDVHTIIRPSRKASKP